MPPWRVGGVHLPDGPYMIGAGVCKTPARAAEWLTIAPVVSGSYTAQRRTGNFGQVMWPQTLEELLTNGYGLNSYGMPNMGFIPAANAFTVMEPSQPLIVSVAGFSVRDYLHGIKIFGSVSSVTAIELNFGCPNTLGDHPDIISFSPKVLDRLLKDVAFDNELTDKPIWLKLSPYSNPLELKRMANIVNKYARDLTLAIVTCNTFPNTYVTEADVTPNNGMAGLSGPMMKPIALGQVKQFRQYLDAEIDVIGVGGISTSDDIVDFLEAGAKAVQITSLAHWAGDPRSFTDHLFQEGTSDRFFQYLEAQTRRSKVW